MSNNGNWTAEEIPNQDGRLAIVTGANTGIGYITALALARRGAVTVLACRDAKKGEDAAQKMRAEGAVGVVSVMQLDLADLASIRAFADAFQASQDRLDLLINNAGVMMPPARWETADGFEVQFGTNHLGHFALTGLLLPLLLATPASRIVTVSSMAHRWGSMNFDDLQAEQKYNPRDAYGQSKLANLLFTYELQRRLAAAQAETLALAAHPGWTATDLQRHSGLFRLLNPLFAMQPEKGALPTLRAAVDPAAQGGDYYGPDGFQEMRGYPKKVSSTEASRNEADAARLWSVSEALTSVVYPLPSSGASASLPVDAPAAA